MKCKHCKMEILGKEVEGYCSDECIEREIIEMEIGNFIDYYTTDDNERNDLYNIMTNFMYEVYEYTKQGKRRKQMRKGQCDTCGKIGIHEYQGGDTEPDEAITDSDITTEAEGDICWECYERKHNLL